MIAAAAMNRTERARSGKFSIRAKFYSLADIAGLDERLVEWVVTSPDGETAQLGNFADAIEIFDLWLHEERCRIAVKQRRGAGIPEA